MAEPLVYTLPEVAEHCKVSLSTVRNWRYAGTLRCIQLPGGSLRVHRDELRRILTPAKAAPEPPEDAPAPAGGA